MTKVSCMGPGGKEITVHIHEDGSVVVDGAPKIKVLIPYIFGKGQLGEVDAFAQKGVLQVYVEPKGVNGAPQVILEDQQRAIFQDGRLRVLTVEGEKGKYETILRDGVGSWHRELKM